HIHSSVPQRSNGRGIVKKLRSKKHEQNQNSSRNQQFSESKCSRSPCYSVRCPSAPRNDAEAAQRIAPGRVEKKSTADIPEKFRGYSSEFVISHPFTSCRMQPTFRLRRLGQLLPGPQALAR